MRLARFRSYLWRNPGVAFVIGFQILLVTAAVLDVSGDYVNANRFAMYGFYALATGVAIQLVGVVREERKRTRADNR